jgi:hypothetical protein
MSKNTILVLMYHRHKLLDLISEPVSSCLILSYVPILGDSNITYVAL